MADCLTCAKPVPTGGRGRRLYCSQGCRKEAELRQRVLRKLERFAGGIGPVPTREELLVLLTAAAKDGSVPAMRALLRELDRGENPSPVSVIDELAAKRKKRSPSP